MTLKEDTKRTGEEEAGCQWKQRQSRGRLRQDDSVGRHKEGRGRRGRLSVEEKAEYRGRQRQVQNTNN
jgi:hypothetical protein